MRGSTVVSFCYLHSQTLSLHVLSHVHYIQMRSHGGFCDAWKPPLGHQAKRAEKAFKACDIFSAIYSLYYNTLWDSEYMTVKFCNAHT